MKHEYELSLLQIPRRSSSGAPMMTWEPSGEKNEMLEEANVGNSQSLVSSGHASHDRRIHFLCKRALDLVLATCLLILFAPLMLLISVLIKLDTPGPIFFVQERVGARRRSQDGQSRWEIGSFPFIKFRSMIQEADQAIHRDHVKAFVEGRLENAPNGSARFKLAKDPRVTRVGRILRKTSLDELPQFINVLRGEMSLVGPRPVPLYEVASYQPWQRERLAAIPGVTGLWQVRGRTELSFDEMVRLDVEYIRRQSLWLDIKILFLTIPAVLSGRGAG
jgi:lipopolysaccharide/colanic/teichoic acid biosynthesis glycosyltransferase